MVSIKVLCIPLYLQFSFPAFFYSFNAHAHMIVWYNEINILCFRLGVWNIFLFSVTQLIYQLTGLAAILSLSLITNYIPGKSSRYENKYITNSEFTFFNEKVFNELMILTFLQCLLSEHVYTLNKKFHKSFAFLSVRRKYYNIGNSRVFVLILHKYQL